MKNTLPVIFALTTLLAACGGSNNGENKGTATQKRDSIGPREEHHHAMKSEPVVLNNGKKWEANAETTIGIQKMIRLVNDLPRKPKIEDYHSLGLKLETEFNTILRQCTMTGEAHNQLHHYLMPMKEIFEGLRAAKLETCETAYAEIKEHLQHYSHYFQ